MCAFTLRSSFTIIQSSFYHFFFFFNDTATTEIYTLSLHDALPICALRHLLVDDIERVGRGRQKAAALVVARAALDLRSEEHTSELQSPCNLVCRLLLEKKKKENKENIEINEPVSEDTHCSQQRVQE